MWKQRPIHTETRREGAAEPLSDLPLVDIELGESSPLQSVQRSAKLLHLQSENAVTAPRSGGSWDEGQLGGAASGTCVLSSCREVTALLIQRLAGTSRVSAPTAGRRTLASFEGRFPGQGWEGRGGGCGHSAPLLPPHQTPLITGGSHPQNHRLACSASAFATGHLPGPERAQLVPTAD